MLFNRNTPKCIPSSSDMSLLLVWFESGLCFSLWFACAANLIYLFTLPGVALQGLADLPPPTITQHSHAHTHTDTLSVVGDSSRNNRDTMIAPQSNGFKELFLRGKRFHLFPIYQAWSRAFIIGCILHMANIEEFWGVLSHFRDHISWDRPLVHFPSK